MAPASNDRDDLPFLPSSWLQTAEGVATKSLGCASLADVPEEHRGHVLQRVGQYMETIEVVPPPRWEIALAKQCGWIDGDA